MRTSLRWAVAVGALMVGGAGAVAATGGFGAAAPPQVNRVEPGRPVDVGPAQLAVHTWTIRSDVATSALESIDGAEGWLVVEAEVTASTDITTRFPESALVLPEDLLLDPDEPAPDRVLLLADGTSAPNLQPGLTARVALLWPVAAGTSPGDELELSYVTSHLGDSNIDSGRVWRVDGTAARVTIPRDDGAGDALAEEEDE